jgi:hypothetical protein
MEEWKKNYIIDFRLRSVTPINHHLILCFYLARPIRKKEEEENCIGKLKQAIKN